MDWLPQTKLYPPLSPANHLPRSGLVDEIYNALLLHRLTLVSALAGAGKTTLLAALGDAYPGLHIAWLSLDEADNSLERFLALLVAALNYTFPEYFENSRNALSIPLNPTDSHTRLLGVLINDLLAIGDEPKVLVLDDLHAIHDPQIFQALDYLLEHIPPNFHIIIATRHDPPLALARLRARGNLAEFRLPDLRFNPGESTALLNDCLHLDLGTDDLTRLQIRTEGWAAGLRLLAVSLDRIPSGKARSDFIAHLASSDRYVFDFLAEEVLAHQEPEMRTFLLETSILSELTPSICQAVTGQEQAALLLDLAYRRNLFLSAVQDRERFYSYHDLFAAFLQERLAQQGAEKVRELHRRAARAQPEPAKAIHHYLAAEQWDEAVQQIQQVGRKMIPLGIRQPVDDWIKALPAEARASQPWMTCLLGTIAFQRGEYEEAQSLLESALQAFSETNDQEGQAESLLQLAGLASGMHNPSMITQLAEQALSLPLTPMQSVLIHISLAWANVYVGDWAQVGSEATAAIQGALSANDPTIYHALAQNLHLALAFAPGISALLEGYCQHVLAQLGDQTDLTTASTLTLFTGLQLLKANIEDSSLNLEKAQRINANLGGFIFLDVNQDLIDLGMLFAMGDYASFERHWQEKLPRFEQLAGAREWLASFLFTRGRVLWLQNREDEAQELYARMQSLQRADDIPENQLALLLMKAMLDMGTKQYDQAETTLRQAVQIQDQAPFTLLFGNASILLAVLDLRRNRLKDAIGIMGNLLAEYDRRDMTGLFMFEGEIVLPLLELAISHGVQQSVAKKLLNKMKGITAPYPVTLPSGESLTPREVQVLRMIAHGASNRQIAAELFITERTVKSHITSILGKLAVISRTQAVARARELHIT